MIVSFTRPLVPKQKKVERNDVRKKLEEIFPVKLQGRVYDEITDAMVALYENKEE